MGLDISFHTARKATLDERTTRMNEIRKQENELSEQLDNLLETDAVKEIRNKMTTIQQELDNQECTDKDQRDKLYNELRDCRYQIRELQTTERTNERCKELSDKLAELSREYDDIYPYEEVAYFRKVNFLMAFFDYEGNCEYKEICKDAVELLIDSCKQVLENHELAEELLPTQGGFFFGGTEYDEYYFIDVKDVLEKFTDILDETDWENENLYMYAWW